MSSALSYRADLDGLRAVAVVPVILYHLGIPHVPGGFVGVDVFFVLSGYFITRLIAKELSEERFSLLGFYDRRIRRLFPALIAVLLVSAFVAMLVLLPEDLSRFGASLAAAALSASNFYFWHQQGYFAPAADTEPLLHTWSLAVEEQFYIFFPLVLLFAWRLGRRHLSAAIILLLVVSFVLGVWATSAFPDAAFYLLPTRAWELALGSILALSLVRATTIGWLRNAAVLAGLVLIGFAIATFSDETPFPGVAAALPCLGCALIIWAGLESGTAAENRRSCLAARVLALAPIVFIGLISYSLYLWHWPIIVFAKYVSIDPLNGWEKAGVITATFAISALSWRLIEQPLRRGDRFWSSRRQRFAYGGAAAMALAAVGVAFDASGGFPQWMPKDVLALSRQRSDSSPTRKTCHADGQGRVEFADTCVVGKEEARHVIVFADSHGVELSYALSEVADASRLQVRQVTASSCPPSLEFVVPARQGCTTHVKKMMDALIHATKGTVIMTAYYSVMAEHRQVAKRLWRGFERNIVALRAAGHDVIILGDVPRHPNGSVPSTLAKWAKLGRSPAAYSFPLDEALSERIDKSLRSMAERTGATYVPLTDYICPEKTRCRAYFDGHAVYFDSHHLTVAMARRVVRDLILPVLRESAEGSAVLDNPSPGDEQTGSVGSLP